MSAFPGETENDFEELCQFAQAAQLDRLGVFSYSDEDSSKSFELDGKVGARAIYQRKRHLMSLQRKISRATNRRLVGRQVQVLVEGPSADSELVWEARMSTQAPDIDGICYISDPGDGPAGPRSEFRVPCAS